MSVQTTEQLERTLRERYEAEPTFFSHCAGEVGTILLARKHGFAFRGTTITSTGHVHEIVSNIDQPADQATRIKVYAGGFGASLIFSGHTPEHVVDSLARQAASHDIAFDRAARLAAVIEARDYFRDIAKVFFLATLMLLNSRVLSLKDLERAEALGAN